MTGVFLMRYVISFVCGQIVWRWSPLHRTRCAELQVIFGGFLKNILTYRLTVSMFQVTYSIAGWQDWTMPVRDDARSAFGFVHTLREPASSSCVASSCRQDRAPTVAPYAALVVESVRVESADN